MTTNTYIGTPFKAHGETLEGLDCWGLCRLVYKDLFKISLPNFKEAYKLVSERKNINDIIDSQVGKWIKIERDELRPGDLVMLSIGGKKCHIGIYINYDRMLHADEKAGVVVESFNAKRWSNRVSGFYRHTERA